jgi:hypothetical protein
MKLTKLQIESAIALEQAWSDYLESTKTPEEADLGILISRDTAGALLKKSRAIEASKPCGDFKEFLRTLSNEEFRELQAIMLIGRGDYKPTDFQKAYDELGIAPNREQDVSYVMEKMGAANYFADGFEKLNIARMI